MATRHPLSFQQQWLWYLLNRDPTWNCTLTYTFRLQGPLVVHLMERSFEEAVRIHSALRTRIVADGDTVVQEIDEVHAPHLGTAVMAGASMAERRSGARSVYDGFCQLRLDPTVAPPLRAMLVELSQDEHWLLLGIHKLIADCFSIDRMFQELCVTYSDLQQRRLSPVSAGGAQYTDYAQIQRSAHAAWLKRHDAYWRARLTGAVPVQWPEDPDVMPQEGSAVAKANSRLGIELSEAIRELARSARTLAANVLLAAYVVVLSRWCQQLEFVVPVYVAGRQSEHREIVGNFSYILYLRVSLTGRETFEEVIRRVGNEFYSALCHQDFGQIAQGSPGLLAGTLFQWITWHPEDVLPAPGSGTADCTGFTVECTSLDDLDQQRVTAIPPGMVDLEATFFDTAEGIRAFFVYRTAQFTPARMSAFIEELRATCEQLIGDPQARADAMIAGKEFSAPPVLGLDPPAQERC